MSDTHIPCRRFTPAEITAWEAAQDPLALPVLDLKRLIATKRFLAEQRRREAIVATRAANRGSSIVD